MEPQPVEPKQVKISVRLMPAVAGLHIVDLRAGRPHADMGINRTAVSFPEPWGKDGHPTKACRSFITESIRDAIRRDHRKRWIAWPDGSCTGFTLDDVEAVLRPPLT
jgi:hypothetical protein